ncbi:MAG: cytochrome c [Elusimicrobia bacterium]|nr:cytochrome c [Elusimicrobiota bacterium]
MTKRQLFYGLNFLILGLSVWAVVRDNTREWKDYQTEFKRLEVSRLKDALSNAATDAEKESLGAALQAAKRQGKAIRQVLANDLGKADRCVTCHVGLDPYANPGLSTPYTEHPYKASEVPEHKSHNLTKFACTSCHMGQGLATTVEDAHGRVAHWEEPMLTGPSIQAACVRCHGDFKTLKGAETAKRGKELIDRLGCVGCHSFNGVGGEISVDLGDIADKPTSRIDWSHTGECHGEHCGALEKRDWNVKNWIELHFTRDPIVLVPGDPEAKQCAPKTKCEPVSPSGMPPFYKELSKEDAVAITAYLMGQTANKYPSDYFVYAAPAKEPAFANPTAHGQYVFQKYGCAGCHGEGGKEGRRNYNAKANDQTKMEEGLEPTLTKVVGNYTREELRKKIHDGVPASAIAKFKEDGPMPPLYMPKWNEKIKGQELEDLITYLFSIAEKQEVW